MPRSALAAVASKPTTHRSRRRRGCGAKAVSMVDGISNPIEPPVCAAVLLTRSSRRSQSTLAGARRNYYDHLDKIIDHLCGCPAPVERLKPFTEEESAA
jgi:hypothetical protein